MKILVWHPVFALGGGCRLFVELVRTLAEHDGVQQVTVAFNEQYHESVTSSWPASVSQHRISTSDNIKPYLADHDVIYVPWPHGITPPAADRPTVCVYQDTILLDAYGGHSTAGFLNAQLATLKSTIASYDCMIVTSNYTKRRICALLPEVESAKIKVLPHIACDEHSNQPRGLDVLPTQDRTSREKAPYILYPANVAEHKNHVSLFAALSKRKRRDVKLVLCGYGTEAIGQPGLTENAYLNRLNKLIRDRQLVPGMDFEAHGYVDDPAVEALWRGALGLIMPTRAEGMGLPINEALNRRLPAIASDIPVLREHFSHRSNAILWVDQECPTELAMAWDTLCDEHAELIRKAQNNISSRVTWEQIGEETQRILRSAKSTNVKSRNSRYRVLDRLFRKPNHASRVA